MEQVRSRQAIREEGARAAQEGKGFDACRYEQGTEARSEWERGHIDASVRVTTRQGRQLAAMLDGVPA